MFVSVDLSVEPWTPIINTMGVSSMVKGRDRPLPVPAGVVETLLAARDDRGLTDFRHEVQVGEQVRILSGPFFNLVGRLERLDDKGRVEVLLSILGGERSVMTDRAALQPVSS
jgi:transcriptional antiterminator RfaH